MDELQRELNKKIYEQLTGQVYMKVVEYLWNPLLEIHGKQLESLLYVHLYEELEQ